MRKEWDKHTEKVLLANLKESEAYVIPDYGEKITPSKNVETQSYHFGKSGLCLFAATNMIKASGLARRPDVLVNMLGEKEASKVENGDFISLFVSLYSNDAAQDWVHTLQCLNATFSIIRSNFSHVQEIILRSDGASNFKCTAMILAIPLLSELSGLNVTQCGWSEAGNGKNKTDSNLQKDKLHIKEGMKKPGARGETAAQLCQHVISGRIETGTSGSAVSKEIVIDRDCDISKPQENCMVGIKKFYHVKYDHGHAGNQELRGMTVWRHHCVGDGKYFSKADMDKKWDKKGIMDMKSMLIDSLNGSGGGGGKCIKSENRRSREGEEAKVKLEAKAAVKVKGDRDKREAMMKQLTDTDGRGLCFCQLCFKPFTYPASRDLHQQSCAEKRAGKDAKKTTSKLRPVAELLDNPLQTSTSMKFGEYCVRQILTFLTPCPQKKIVLSSSVCTIGLQLLKHKLYVCVFCVDTH